jgi:hypothetical protein
MTVGTHTWSHKDLARNPYAKDLDQAKREIEMGNSVVHIVIYYPGVLAHTTPANNVSTLCALRTGS